jgi:ubiquinone/menaquinone biosynthesis C-methylase UbiE|tara:strand:+ start:764 stop:1363 length:600 start_codon:yes stop_codon:yes gene_type:complete
MDINDLKRINSLWSKIYPYLASQIMEGYRRDSGVVLELGPFSGGISLELIRLHPKLNITIADESPAAVEYLRQEISTSGLSQKIAVKKTDLNHLAFDDSQFDLVIFRGAVFFLKDKENLLQEVFRVLKDEGMAFIGGGFGKGTPQELVDEIADESRELNNRLGRPWVSIEELEEMIRKSELTDKGKIVEDGGLWLNIEK